MVKRRIKQILSVFLLILILFGTVACGTNEKQEDTQITENPDVTEETNGDAVSEEEKYLILYQNKKANFNIVFDKNMDMGLGRYLSCRSYRCCGSIHFTYSF